MGDTIIDHGAYGRVTIDDFSVTFGGRVAIVGGNDVGCEDTTQFGEFLDESRSMFSCFLMQLFFVIAASFGFVEIENGKNLIAEQNV